MKFFYIFLLCMWSIVGNAQDEVKESPFFQRVTLDVIRGTGEFDVVYFVKPQVTLLMFAQDSQNLELGQLSKMTLVVDGVKYDFSSSAVWKDSCLQLHTMGIRENDVEKSPEMDEYSIELVDARHSKGQCIEVGGSPMQAHIIHKRSGVVIGTQSFKGRILPQFKAEPALQMQR